MHAASFLLRTAYRCIAFLTIPGQFWAAFELYGMTLHSSHMIFYSIVHTMPVLAMVVVLSLPLGLAWLLQSIVALSSARYAGKLQIPRSTHWIFVITLVVHGLALVGYDTWSLGLARIPLCLLGLFLTGLSGYRVWRHVLLRSKASEPTQ